MSILIEYKNGKLKTATLVSERKTPSPSYQCEDTKTFCIGDIYDVTFEDLSKMDWQVNPKVLNDILGTKAIAQADCSNCTFAVDMNGWDTFYYYYAGSRFILSDNFWDIVKRLEPTYEDLNPAKLRRYLLVPPVSGETFIRNLYMLPPSHISVYDAEKNILTVKKYQEFQYSGEITDIAEAADRVDAVLHDAMEKIKGKCGDVLFGSGLSGGMDSRLIPHYAKAHGLRLVTFNTCIPKPHGFLHAQSIIRAQNLAKIFDIPFTPVRWKNDKIKEKLRFVTKNNPLDGGGCAFKHESDGKPQYDIHLTGTAGEVIGDSLPRGLSQLSEQELTDIILQSFFPSFTTSFSNQASRAISYLLDKKAKIGDSDRGMLMSRLLTDQDYAEAKEEIVSFVSRAREIGKSNIEIFEDYLFNVFCSRARSGAHESAIATKRAFSIYIPFILREVLNWDPILLEDRAVLTELIRRHVPEVANVRAETFFAAANDQTPGVVSKALALAETLLRGNGTAIERYTYRKRQFRKIFLNEMNQNRNSWFHRAMGICDMEITEKMMLNDTPRAASRVWQMKDVVDCLEHKDYLSF